MTLVLILRTRSKDRAARDLEQFGLWYSMTVCVMIIPELLKIKNLNWEVWTKLQILTSIINYSKAKAELMCRM